MDSSLQQSAHSVLLVRPVSFRPNQETTSDNFFQERSIPMSDAEVQASAATDFNRVRKMLVDNGVHILCFDEDPELDSPDSIFPNNWFSTHQGAGHQRAGFLLYPMKALNRRRERREDIISELRKRYKQVKDLTGYEEQGKYLESTGSMVLDRLNQRVFACISSRTDATCLHEWCEFFDYDEVRFRAADKYGKEIYHTNVMLSIGTHFAVCCFEAISNDGEREEVRRLLSSTGRELIEIDFDQMSAFCGNCLELQNERGELLIAMSSQAYESFSSVQLEQLESCGRIIHCDISTIERVGGGGVRCMMAELF